MLYILCNIVTVDIYLHQSTLHTPHHRLSSHSTTHSTTHSLHQRSANVRFIGCQKVNRSPLSLSCLTVAVPTVCRPDAVSPLRQRHLLFAFTVAVVYQVYEKVHPSIHPSSRNNNTCEKVQLFYQSTTTTHLSERRPCIPTDPFILQLDCSIHPFIYFHPLVDND